MDLVLKIDISAFLHWDFGVSDPQDSKKTLRDSEGGFVPRPMGKAPLGFVYN